MMQGKLCHRGCCSLQCQCGDCSVSCVTMDVTLIVDSRDFAVNGLSVKINCVILDAAEQTLSV